NEKAAVSKAAMDTLSALYPQQSATFAAAYSQVLDSIPANPPRRRGIELGTLVAAAILAERSNDGSELNVPYTFGTSPGDHQPDPLHPNQGVYAPHWYHVDPFVIDDIHTYLGSPPPPLTSPEYTLAYQEVLAYGGNGTTTPTIRNAEQTTIGIFWGYDGAKGLGTPPRLYNQIARAISLGRRNSADENARLFALINLAMADAGIQCWYTKYYYNFWRPVIGIQQGNTDGNPATIGDPLWLPLGAPATNGTGDGIDFTPPFPAYSSGHATFGAAAFYTIANFYGTTRIPFEFVSDEFNGLNRGSDGNIRPLISRTYGTLDDAVWENGVSRIYLGVHWSFDATMGIASGHRIANKVSSSVLLPKRGKAKD
ncbi:MAG: vanadium-dependent haloperoxidase, partial [Pirellula sp.]